MRAASARGTRDCGSELGIPAILVHSKAVDPPDLAEALASGATALLPADAAPGAIEEIARLVAAFPQER